MEVSQLLFNVEAILHTALIWTWTWFFHRKPVHSVYQLIKRYKHLKEKGKVGFFLRSSAGVLGQSCIQLGSDCWPREGRSVVWAVNAPRRSTEHSAEAKCSGFTSRAKSVSWLMGTTVLISRNVAVSGLNVRILCCCCFLVFFAFCMYCIQIKTVSQPWLAAGSTWTNKGREKQGSTNSYNGS